MRKQADAELALECLRLATSEGEAAEDVVARASAYLDFVRGDSESAAATSAPAT